MTILLFATKTGHTFEIILTLFIMLAAAKIAAELFGRLHQPAVIGEILAGVIIGGSVLGWVTPSEFTDTLAEIGVIFLLFTVGLETKPSAIFKVGRIAARVALLGVVVPFICGYLLMWAWGGNNIQSLFVGTALVATSIGITARVLSGLGLLNAPTSRIILGAAVIDDILGLMILAVVSSLAAGSINYFEIGLTTVLSIGFTALIALVGARFLTYVSPYIQRLRTVESLFVFSLILCLGLSVAAAYIGIAAIIGAFLAGMAMAEAGEGNYDLHKQTGAVTEFLVPFFLVNIGMQIKLDVFYDFSTVLLAVLVTLVAVLTKLVGCGLASISFGWRRAAQVGMGMTPRGEVGIVVAQLGLSLAVISEALYGVVLFMAVATTIIAPPFLKWLFANEKAITDKIDRENADSVVSQSDFSRLG